MGLNEKQQLVVNEIYNNILLLASAGTGKTDVLAKRVGNIINSGKAKANEILCITFTNKACKEMEIRINDIVLEKAKGITIKTFHGFCFDLIKEQAKKNTDIFTDFLIYDEEDCKEILATCNYFNYPIKALKDFVDTVKSERARLNIYTNNNNVDIENTIKYLFKNNEDKIDRICSERQTLNSEMKEYMRKDGVSLVVAYNALLMNNHGLDFNDLIVNAQDLFNNEDIVKSISSRYKYINIDEMQDTSTLEYSIIEKIFSNSNILLCGDIFQTIYQWRGSDPNIIFQKYKAKYNPVEIVFNKNYRATKNLTNASLGFLKNGFEEIVNTTYKDGIQAETLDEGHKIKVSIRNGVDDEGRFIISELETLLKQGEDIESTCILTRDNGYNVALSKALSSYNDKPYKFILVDQFKFFRRQEIKDVISFLKLIANRNDSLSLRRIISRIPCGVGETTLNDIDSAKYKKIGVMLSDYIDKDVINYGEKYSLLIEEVDNNNVIVFDVESTGINVTEDEIIQIAAIKINKEGKAIEIFERFLKNTKPVGTSEYVHGFSDEYLRVNGEEKECVLKDFLEFSKGSIIVGHNVQYDINILNSELSKLNLEKPSFKGIFDTLDIYRRFYPNAVNHKLDNLSEVFKTNHKPSHNAMDDILATGELLVYAVNNFLKPTSMERMALMNSHLKAFTYIRGKLNDLFVVAESKRPYEIVAYIMNEMGLKTIYTGEKASEKVERLRDFYSLLRDLDMKEKSNRDSLLDIITMTGLSNGELEELIVKRSKITRIPIITVHQAKGLEYKNVFLAGMQEETFPSYGAVRSNNMDEEKRTFYVAITRAKKRLYISANTRGIYGYTKKPSRFIKMIPEKYIL